MGDKRLPYSHMDRRLPIPRWRRRGLELKIAVVLIIVLCYFLFNSPFSGSADVPAVNPVTARTPLPPREGSASTLQRLGVDPELLKGDATSEKNLAKDKYSQDDPPSARKAEQAASSHQESLRPGLRALEESPGSIHPPGSAADIARVGVALRNVLSNLPDEGQIEDLLVPFRGTGTVKLRDVGTRARAYKKYLKLWEALHMIQDGRSAHIRDDILRLIRDSHDRLDLPDLTLAQTLRSYESFRHLVTRLADLLFPWTAPYFADHMTLHAGLYKAGKGIVLSAGQDQVPYLLATIPAMRKLGCKLPIEIMYLGDEDISEDLRETLETLPGVITRDIKKMTKDTGWELAGWAAKPFAMLLSSFQEVMFIDADAVFFRNPALLFQNPQYQANGALFFQDRSIFPESKRRWLRSILPKPISKSAQKSRLWSGESGHQQESGVVLIDKWKHFVELLLVTRMNGPDRDGNKDQGIEGIYDMVYGDKETFWLSWELLRNSHYAFHDGFRGSMGAVHRGSLAGDKKPEVADDQPSGSGDLASGLAKQAPADPQAKSYESQAEDSGSLSVDAGNLLIEDAAVDDVTPAPLEDTTEAEVTPIMVDSAEMDLDTPSEDDSRGLKKRSTPRGPDVETRTNYTICAPQLLHLDADRRPLWFNGWLARNKFKDSSQSVPAKFEVWNMEPPMASKTDAWQLGESNEACLTSDSVTEFTAQEQEVLQMVISLAQDVKALGKGKKE